MDNRDYKDFVSLLILMVSRYTGELSMALGWVLLVVGLWKFAPDLMNLAR
jgi:hypothetical protein